MNQKSLAYLRQAFLGGWVTRKDRPLELEISGEYERGRKNWSLEIRWTGLVLQLCNLRPEGI
jgi:hypothetical protein